jgi:hypothetical protein
MSQPSLASERTAIAPRRPATSPPADVDQKTARRSKDDPWLPSSLLVKEKPEEHGLAKDAEFLPDGF